LMTAWFAGPAAARTLTTRLKGARYKTQLSAGQTPEAMRAQQQLLHTGSQCIPCAGSGLHNLNPADSALHPSCWHGAAQPHRSQTIGYDNLPAANGSSAQSTAPFTASHFCSIALGALHHLHGSALWCNA
jgi:hypothetical protein